MAKLGNISEIHPTLGFTEFDILEKYCKSFNESELGRLHFVFPFGSFGTQKQHYSLSRIKARNRKTEILWIFFGIHTANAVQMIDKIKKRLNKAAWHDFADRIRRGHRTSSGASCPAG